MKHRWVLCLLVAMVTIVNGLRPSDETEYNAKDEDIDNKEPERIHKFTPKGLRSQLGLARERIGCKYQRRGSVPCNRETNKETLKLISGDEETCAPTIDRKCKRRGGLFGILRLIWPEKELNENIEVKKIDAENNKVKKTGAKKVEDEKIAVEESAIDKMDAENIEVENEEAEKVGVEKMNDEKAEVEKMAAENNEAKKMGAQKAEDEKIDAVESEIERMNAGNIEVEKMNAEKAEVENMAVENIEVKKMGAQKAEDEKIAVEESEIDKMDAENIEVEKMNAEKAEVENMAVENIEVKKMGAQKAEDEKIAVEESEIDKMDAENIEVENEEAEQVGVEEMNAEKAEVENMAAENNEAKKMGAKKVEDEKIDAVESEIERMDAENIEVENEEAEKVEVEKMNAEKAEGEKMDAEIPLIKKKDTREVKIKNMDAKNAGVKKIKAENDKVTMKVRKIIDERTQNVKTGTNEDKQPLLDYYKTRFKKVAPDLDVESMTYLEIIQLYHDAKMELLEESDPISRMAVFHKMREAKIKSMSEESLPDKQPFLKTKHSVKDANDHNKTLFINQYPDSSKMQTILRNGNGASHSTSKIDDQEDDTETLQTKLSSKINLITERKQNKLEKLTTERGDPDNTNNGNSLIVLSESHSSNSSDNFQKSKIETDKARTISIQSSLLSEKRADKNQIVEKANENRDPVGQQSLINESDTEVMNVQNDPSHTKQINEQLDNRNEKKGNDGRKRDVFLQRINSIKSRHEISTLDANNDAFTSNINIVDNNGDISTKTASGINLPSETMKKEKQGKENDDLSSGNEKINAIDFRSENQAEKNSHKNYFKEMRRLNLLQLKKIKMRTRSPINPFIPSTKNSDKNVVVNDDDDDDDDDDDNNHTILMDKLDETDYDSTKAYESRTSKEESEHQKLTMKQINVNEEMIVTDNVTSVDTSTAEVPKVLGKTSYTVMNVVDEKEVNGKANNDNSPIFITPQTQSKTTNLINVIENESPSLGNDEINGNENRDIKSTDNNPINKNMVNNQPKVDRTVIEEPPTSPQVRGDGRIIRTRARNSDGIRGNGRRNENAITPRRQRNRENENNAFNNVGPIRGEVLNRIRSTNPRNRMRSWNNPFTVNRGRIQDEIRRRQQQWRASDSNTVNEARSNETTPARIRRPPSGCRYQSSRSVPCNPETQLRTSQLISGPSSCPKSRSIRCRGSRQGRRRGSRRRNKRQAIFPDDTFIGPDMTFHSQFTIPHIAIPDDILMSHAQMAETASLLSMYQGEHTRPYQLPFRDSVPTQFNGHEGQERGTRVSVNSGSGRQTTNARRGMRSRPRGDRRGPIRPRQKNNTPSNYDSRGAPNTIRIPDIREAANTASDFNIMDRSTANDPSRPIVESQLFADNSVVFTDDQPIMPENGMSDRPSSMTDEDMGAPRTNQIPSTQNRPSPRNPNRRQARINNSRPAPRRPGRNRNNGSGRRRNQRPSRTRNILSRLFGRRPRVRSTSRRPGNNRSTRPMARQPRRRQRFSNRNPPNRSNENSNVAFDAPDQEYLDGFPDRDTFDGKMQTNHRDSQSENYPSAMQRVQEEDNMFSSQDHEYDLSTKQNEDITKIDNENNALWEEGAFPDSNGQVLDETPMTDESAPRHIENALSEDWNSTDD